MFVGAKMHVLCTLKKQLALAIEGIWSTLVIVVKINPPKTVLKLVNENSINI